MSAKPLKIGSIFRAVCPACDQGKIYQGPFRVRPKCTVCGYNFHPEPGFYLGAMVVSFLLTAMLTIPPMIALKLLNVDIMILITFPFVEYLFVGTFLTFYGRVLWLHLEYRMTGRLG